MQRRLCEMSEAKWSITEAKCLQISHNKYASQRDAISHSMGNLMLSHSTGMHNTDKSIAGISKRFHFASLHYIFSAYLPTHIKFLTEFHRIFFGTTCISFPMKFRFGRLTHSLQPIKHTFQGFFAVKRRAVFILGAMWIALVRGWRRDCVVGGMETRFQ